VVEKYPVIILGGGPAGLTAAIYTCRSQLKTLLVDHGLVGGQITLADRVENFPGFPQGINGMELGELVHQQASQFGLETLPAEVTEVVASGDVFTVRTSNGDFRCSALIVALGADHQKLGVPGEEELLGRGVSYCANCDGAFFQGKEVAVVGGGNSAVSDALFLTKMAKKVHVVHRRHQLRAEAILQEQAMASPRIEFVWDSVVERVEGDGVVSGLRTRRVDTGETSLLPLSGVFVAVGSVPATRTLKGVVDLTPQGHIVTGHMMETSRPGIFACGEARQHAVRQAIASAGDGCTAAIAAIRYLQEQTP
jgi:thioredoxin reductase (NADPH)